MYFKSHISSQTNGMISVLEYLAYINTYSLDKSHLVINKNNRNVQ